MVVLHLDFSKALGTVIPSIVMWELRRSGWVSRLSDRLNTGWTLGLSG